MTHGSVRRLLLAFTAALAATGCLDQSRVNAKCEWTDPSALAQLDLHDRAQRAHLVSDVRIAEELGVRAGDAVKRQVGVPASGKVRLECTEQMFASITRQHGVSRADIEGVRGVRNVWVDAATVYLPMILLLGIVSDRILRRLLTLPAEDRWLVVTGVIFFSVVTSAIAIAVTQYWVGIVESLRYGDSHLSYRAFYIPINQHGWIAFFTGLAVYAMAAVRRLARR